jgi:hypothetical protein
LVTAHLAEFEVMFPELGKEDSVEENSEVFPDDEDAVLYDFSHATYDPKAVEEEMREMLARAARSQEDTFEVPTYDEWL